MGKKVKTIIGLGLAIASGGIFAANFFAIGGIAISYASVATLVGLSLLGSALAPDVGDMFGADTYAGHKLQTQKSNVSPVPILYGKHRVAGNIIFQETNSAVNADDEAHGYNRDYWAIIILAGHDINTIDKAYANETELSQLGYTNRYQSTYTHIRWYDASSSSTSLNSVSFLKDSAGNESTGSTLGLTNITIPADVAYIAVHQAFDNQHNNNTQLMNITVQIEGKEIRTITNSTMISSTISYSTNPAEIVLDLLSNGLNIADSDIDIATFYDSKTKCNTNSWTCNIALIQQANIQSIIQDVLATFRGSIVHSDSKWKLKVDTKQQTNVATLTDDDFINNSLNISMKGNREIANKIIVKYVNPADEWLSAQVVKEDTDLQDLDGQLLEKILDIKGITNATHAGQFAEITLNSMRYTEDASGNRLKQTPLVLSFATTVKNADLEVGDVISIDHDVLDRVRKFVILSVETDQSGLIQVATREYCEQHYKDSSGNYLI